MFSLPVEKMAPMEYQTPTYLQLDATAMLNDQKKQISYAREQPSSMTKKPNSFTAHESPDDPIYITIPVSEPPTPPPRDQEFKFSHEPQRTVSLHVPPSRPKRLSVIDERDENMKSPGVPSPRNQRTTQSLRSPRRPDSLEASRPCLDRQSSRGDVLISEVLSTVKSKV